LNSIFVSPMCQYSGTDGCVNGWHLVHVCSAAVGAGCVLTEAKATEVLPTAGSVGLIWVSTVKRACVDRAIAGDKPTSRYQSGQLAHSPFLDSFRVAANAPGQ